MIRYWSWTPSPFSRARALRASSDSRRSSPDDRSPAVSTTGPVSGGIAGSARATDASASSATAAARVKGFPAPLPPSELHLRRLLRALRGRGELRLRRLLVEQRVRPARRRDRDEVVELLDLLDVAAPGDRDPVLGALELSLQVAEVLVRLELRVVLGDREQPAERAPQLALRRLELLHVLRRELVDVELHRGRLRAGVHHLVERLPLVRRVALHRLDEVRHEVGAALVLVLDLAPRGGDGVLGLRDGLVAAARDERGRGGDGEEAAISHGRES